MNRFTRALLALTVGFAGATAAVRALDESTSFNDPVYVGDPDFFDYCRDVYGSTAAALSYEAGAQGWRSAARIDGMFQLKSVDVDDMCVRQYGVGAIGHSTDIDDPESWECLLEQ